MGFFRRDRSPHPVPLWRRYRAFFRPNVDVDVEDELRFHLEMRIADYERRGYSREEAERLARAQFGDVDGVRTWLTHHDRQRQRRETRIEIMDSLLQDVRYAARRLSQRPGFALTVILVLGLGIGAATTMFSAVDAALLRPLPFQRDDRLVTVGGVYIPLEGSTSRRRMGIEEVSAMRGVFTHVAAYAPGGLNLSNVNAPRRLDVALVTPDFFATLGIPIALGRGFTADEGKPGAPHVAVISDGLWRDAFGADPDIVGKDVRLSDVPYQIVGVMPRGFRFPEETEAWLPLTSPIPKTFALFEAFRGWLPSTFIARLAPGATLQRANAVIGARIRQYQTPEEQKKALAEQQKTKLTPVRPLRDVLVGERRTPLLVLMGATALVLLVACANVTNLLLSRALAQRGELALRSALGASRTRIVRQLLVESLLLALGGGVVGTLFAFAGVGVLGALMPPTLAGAAPTQVDVRVLAFSLGTVLFTGIVSGLWPALTASRANANETIKSSGPNGSVGREGTWARRTFVVAELALALMLAVGAGLMLHSLQQLLATDLGVRPASVATLELTLPRVTYMEPAARRRFFDEVAERARALPGVQEVAAVNELPLRGMGTLSLVVEPVDRPRGPDKEPAFAQLLYATPSYFATLGIPLVRGRTFSVPYDSARPPEVVISESLARAAWPGEDPIGKRIKNIFGGPPVVVVGVVGDVRPQSAEGERQPQMYFDMSRTPQLNAALLARGTLPPKVLATRLRDAVRAVDPAQAVYNVRPMTDVISGAIAPRRTNTTLLTLFGIVAVGLAAMGVYGVIAYGVTRRTKEIGIRMALGAQPRNILSLIAREGIVLSVLGIALGAAGAWALRKVVASLLYGVSADDPLAFAGAAFVLFAIALVATLVPARAALKVDPARTIRVE
jgi:predicted permease